MITNYVPTTVLESFILVASKHTLYWPIQWHTGKIVIVNWTKALHSQLKHLLTYLKFLKTCLAYHILKSFKKKQTKNKPKPTINNNSKKTKASVSQTDGDLIPLLGIWWWYLSDTMAESSWFCSLILLSMGKKLQLASCQRDFST